MSNYGSQSTSLQGLERTMRELPTPRQTPRPSVSSRKSSSSSVNKPLPPEPPPPLFSITPSPKSSPKPLPPGGDRARRTPEPRQTQNPRPAGGRREPEELRVSPQSLSPFGGRHKSPGRTGSNGSGGPPLSAASEIATSIIDSYSNRGVMDPVPRNATPLIAPHAQSSRVLSMQHERLQSFEAFDPNTLSPNSEQMLAVAAADTPEGTMQRKDTLAYRFDTPTESDPPVIFQQPLWAIDDDSLSAEDIALRYRNTLPPSPFSPVSEYEDDEITSTPTIPVLPPLPANSPFRLPSPVANGNARAVSRSPHSKKRSAQQQTLLPHSPAISRESSPGQNSRQMSAMQAVAAAARPFGSQASWEPGDDAVRLRGASAASEKQNRPRPSLLSRYSKESEQCSVSEFLRLSPNPQSSSSVPGTPPPVLGASIDRPLSGPSFSDILAKNSPSSTPYGSKLRKDSEQRVSYWSDDSDDGSKKLRAIGARFRKMRAGKAHSGATSTGSRVSSANARTISSVETAEPQSRAFVDGKERPSFTSSREGTADGTQSTSTHFRTDPETKPSRSKSANERHGAHRSLPPTESRPFSPSSPLTHHQPLSDFKAKLALRSRTWGVESAGEESSKSDLGWIARLRKKNRVEAQREKRREDMKRKIKVVQSGPQGMMAIVATQEMRERVAANDAGSLEHF